MADDNGLYPDAASPVDSQNGLSPVSWAWGDPEAYGAAQASRAMEPVVSPYLKNVLTGQVAAQGLGRLITPYDPAKSFAQNALNPQGLEVAQDIAMGFAGPGMFVGEKSLRGPGGTNGFRALQDAEYMDSTGQFSRQDIFNVTGWFKQGKDWQTVIPDTNARLKTENLEQISNPNPYSALPDYITHKVPDADPYTGANLKLGGILEHPQLFDAYPWLKDLDVTPILREPGAARGEYVPNLSAQLGMVGPGGPGGRIGLLDAQEPDMLSTLLHEIQHTLQFEENWPKGGSPELFLPKNFDKQVAKANIENDAVAGWIHNAGYDPREVAGALGIGPDFDQPIKHLMGKEMGLPDDIIDEFTRTQTRLKRLGDMKNEAYQKYRRLGGEIQARATQAQHATGQYGLPEESGTYKAFQRTGGTIEPYPPEADHIITYEKGDGTYHVLEPIEGDPFATTPGGEK